MPLDRTCSVAILGAALAVLLPSPSAGAENIGRVLGLNEAVTTPVTPEGDVDDLVFDAGAGWKLKAVAKRAKTADVLPVLELVGPDGAVVTEGVVARAGKSSAKVAATLLEGGRFALRVRGSSGTGDVTVKWKLKPAKVAADRNRELAADTTREYGFPARGGALVSWKLKFKGDGAAQVTAVTGPDGSDGGYDPEDPTWVRRSLTSETVKSFPLPAAGPGGDWSLRVENKLFTSLASLSIKVKLPRVAKSTSLLTAEEPFLTEISHALSTCGVGVVVTGGNLGSVPRGLWFGPAAATALDVVEGTTATCRVPGGTGTVDLLYVAADGQVAVLPAAFTFKPLPTLSSFTPTVGPGAGRIDMTVTGSGFETEAQGLYEILVGGVPASRVAVESPTKVTCRIPAHVAGPKSVVLRNPCGQTVTAPGVFTYSSLLAISTILPEAVPVFGGVPVTVYGAGFTASDTVHVAGSPVASTPVLFSGAVIGHRIPGSAILARPPGAVDVEVRASGGASALKAGGLAYFTFADATSTAIPAATSLDDWGGVSTAAVDRDLDGTVDWILLTHTTSLSSVRPGTRVLVNDGNGVFTDGTGTRMPAPELSGDGFGGNRVIAGRFDGDSNPDIYLSRPGTGTEARRTGDRKWIAAWGRLLFSDGSGYFSPQVAEGAFSKFSIPGILTFTNCFVYDYDFRSVTAGLGDLDGDLDQDIVLVNDQSITSFTGVNCAYGWITCAGTYTSCYTSTSNPVGSALRICTVGSTGAVFDRTKEMLTSQFSAGDDFRGVAVAVGDVNGDFLNDIVVTHNAALGPTTAATRAFTQKNVGVNVTFSKKSGFVPNPAVGTDDWRGDALAIPDLNGDLLRDLVVSLDSDPPGGGAHATRILLQNPVSGNLEDRTATLLGGVLPAGDKGYARVVVATDIDRDGDTDLVLATTSSTGTGNRRTRLILNVDRDPSTGYPVLVDASSLLPDPASDPGSALSVLVADVNGDGFLDLVLTDGLNLGSPQKRTRIWRQVR